ncbi:phage tail P2-like protein [Ancylobacter sp. 3268]|uniref:phage tail protein I n=1 Tax=Ancylobacter sp. 3268 TaxID=2817752 RepID=UPI00285BC64D|nr:phage tail protein I [Ancylobacter sp. 3268]MDR6952690.1 phage tail P2-like protein [Ancylobacter sp. 3268]
MAERVSILKLIPPPLAADERVRALLGAFEAALDELDAPDLMLLDPADVREEALPYLAYEHSLGEFVGPGLPTPIIRDMILNAWKLHEPKGYGVGIVGGIAMLGYDAELFQWWQESPKGIRGTHHIEVPINEPLWPGAELTGTEEVRAIWRMIHAMQRWSQDHGLRITSEAEVSQPVGVGVLSATSIQIEPWTPEAPEVSSTVTAGVGLLAGWRISIEPLLGWELVQLAFDDALVEFDGAPVCITLPTQGLAA